MSATADSIAVRVERVSKRYAHRVKGDVYAARDVDLRVAPGEFLTLLGPSGCGKTTTLRIIAGYEPPDSGRVLFGDHDVTREPANLRNIGFVFQNYALFPHLSVFENVAYGLRVRALAARDVDARVRDVLAQVGLSGYEPQFPSQLSGGEQQRVALARAIVIQPRVLLFDEPLSNLDAKLRVQMRREIHDLQRRLAITTVYVTHDQEEAMAVSDRIVVMNEGSVVQEGTSEDLYHRPASRFVAQFVGRVNLLHGRIAEVAEGRASVEALGTTIVAAAPQRGLAPGQAVELVLRPEAIELSAGPPIRAAGPPQGANSAPSGGLGAPIRAAGPPQGANSAPSGGLGAPIRATVVSRTFLGEKVEYVIECAGERLQVVRYNAGADGLLAAGASVSLQIDPRAVALLPTASR